jgi:5-formaminoimidazole-4-carboxamide-1-beta-D-ribofuranosyl 5'-monophosphate synthetase
MHVRKVCFGRTDRVHKSVGLFIYCLVMYIYETIILAYILSHTASNIIMLSTATEFNYIWLHKNKYLIYYGKYIKHITYWVYENIG